MLINSIKLCPQPTLVDYSKLRVCETATACTIFHWSRDAKLFSINHRDEQAPLHFFHMWTYSPNAKSFGRGSHQCGRPVLLLQAPIMCRHLVAIPFFVVWMETRNRNVKCELLSSSFRDAPSKKQEWDIPNFGLKWIESAIVLNVFVVLKK